jgi:murein DD-endopeptidase MepM/ murein hydrolase activator NlpD
LLIGSTNTINKKISINKKILKEKKNQHKYTNIKIKTLAKQIKKQEKEYIEIEKKLTVLNTNIFLNKVKLDNIKEQIIKLELQAKNIQQQSNLTKKNMINEIANRYSASLGISLAKKHTIKEIIDKEVYNLLLNKSSSNILELNLKYLKSTIDTQKNKNKIMELTKYIKEQESQKLKYDKLKEKKKKIIKKLDKQYKLYQSKLKNIIRKQRNLQKLLGKLNILKKQEIKKQEKKKIKSMPKKKITPIKNKEIRIKQKQKFKKEIDIEVRNIGSSTKGIKISHYKGRKTIAPLKSYTILKEFGKYYDPIYKIKLFNEALSMKPNKANSKVYNVLNGKIVYAKKNAGTLENVVITQHQNGLHTIYSHLDKIAPTLKVGKWIKKGFVVGRVSDTLMFQVTKNSKYINPRDLF